MFGRIDTKDLSGELERGWEVKRFLITYKRYPECEPETLIYSGTSILRFTLVEIDRGRIPVILWSQEISEEEYVEAFSYYFDVLPKNIQEYNRV